MNFFRPRSAARRYAKGRPHFHPAIIERARKYLSPSDSVARALDVGCGTGLSTLALKEIAEEIIGIDAAPEMVALAPEDASIQYCIANAEYLPFREETFDLVTLSQVVHWLDRERFLKEAGRILRARGWLIVYDNYFTGRMEENPEFHQWHQESFLEKYPSPHRARASFTAEKSRDEGFELLNQEWHQNGIKFSIEALTDYLTTQSNMIAAVEGGRETIEEARAWLLENIRPLFGEREEAEFVFSAPIWYLRRVE